MSLSVGIVGFPNVGKSTLFKTITKKQVDCLNYAFCTIDPNVGVVSVPDNRIEELSALFNPKKKIYSTIEFVDIAGLVEGASKGEGLGNRFLAHVRETDVIVYVLRLFKKSDVVSVRNEVDPLKERELLDSELMLKDLETVEKRLEGVERDVRSGNKRSVFEAEVFKKVKKSLEEGVLLIRKEFSEEEKEVLRSCNLLTIKPRICLLNGSEKEDEEGVIAKIAEEGDSVIVMDIMEEHESADFTPKERVAFGFCEEPKMDNLIKECYKLLDLITFFTVGSDEVRAWKIKRGFTAPQAGGVIHTDFEKSFIKAEVVNWKDLVHEGSLSQAKGKGLVRLEGKDYVMQDGDVVEIKHG